MLSTETELLVVYWSVSIRWAGLWQPSWSSRYCFKPGTRFTVSGSSWGVGSRGGFRHMNQLHLVFRVWELVAVYDRWQNWWPQLWARKSHSRVWPRVAGCIWQAEWVRNSRVGCRYVGWLKVAGAGYLLSSFWERQTVWFSFWFWETNKLAFWCGCSVLVLASFPFAPGLLGLRWSCGSWQVGSKRI